jgi:DNA polymerase-3 subunit alpha
MKPLRVIAVKKLRNDKVYDIKHLLDSKNFLNDHPNLVVNDLIISNCSRHAGGVVVGENLDVHMPLINSDGVRQTPWAEGQNVRHLEPMGFIKFDILGIASLRMIESAIRHILKRHFGVKEPTFEDVKKFYNDKLHPERMDLNDKKVYKNVFQKGNFAGIFQFTERGAQELCKKAKPNNIIDLSAITSIYRPGPLSANVDKDYIVAKEAQESIKYIHPIIKQILEPTYGFCLAGNSLVSTDNGEFTIEEIVEKKMIGISLPSYNTQTGDIEQDYIEDVKYMGEKQTYILQTEDGTLELTADHIVFTKRGEVQVQNLTIEDEIICIK